MLLNNQNESPEETKLRIDKLLEKNSREPIICISCQKPIKDDQAVLKTIHGSYHGWPLSCVEGRTEKEYN